MLENIEKPFKYMSPRGNKLPEWQHPDDKPEEEVPVLLYLDGHNFKSGFFRIDPNYAPRIYFYDGSSVLCRRPDIRCWIYLDKLIPKGCD